jgi:hypothetical protein
MRSLSIRVIALSLLCVPGCAPGAASDSATDVPLSTDAADASLADICGASGSPCQNGASCAVSADCASGICDGLVCKAPGWLLGDGGVAKWTTILAQGLDKPEALAFNPMTPDEMWIANAGDHSLTLLNISSGDTQNFVDDEAHFLEAVDAISFSDNGTFATCGDTRNDYDGSKPSNDFMGPVLWPGGVDAFDQFGPDASKVHLDMMHDTPWCMGIAASSGNMYYVFNGVHGTIDWYDFGKPHANGGTNHTDGAKKRFNGMNLKRVAGVPSHLVFDAESGLLYVADTGNARIVRLDTMTGTAKGGTQTWGDEVKVVFETGETMDELVVDGLTQPSGLLLYRGFLYTSDAATGVLHAYDLDGNEVRQLDSGLGAGVLAGIAAGADGGMYVVDRKKNRVLRLDF